MISREAIITGDAQKKKRNYVIDPMLSNLVAGSSIAFEDRSP